MRIRLEEENEYPEIYHLVETAFQTAHQAGGDEQDFVERLRSSGNYIRELALVAEEDGKLIAHVMLTRLLVSSETSQYPVLLLAPLAVLLEYRNKGVGTRLVQEAFERARELGYSQPSCLETLIIIRVSVSGRLSSLELGMRTGLKIDL